MVCEHHHGSLFKDVDETVLKGMKCVNGGCNTKATRVASWKTSVVLSLVIGTSVPMGSLVCPRCNNLKVDGESSLMDFIREEDRLE